jgi:Domain of unknown function (DUF4132)
MFFTKEEIDNALATGTENLPLSFTKDGSLASSVNYPGITGYLTGQSNALGALQIDNKNFYWALLINLITDLEHISPKEQRVLDVIYQPLIFSYTRYHVNNWMKDYFFVKKTDPALQAVIQHLRKQGLNDEAVFQFFVFDFHQHQEEMMNIDCLKAYLLVIIKKSRTLIYPANSSAYWDFNWSISYFKLLEEANPAFALEYAYYGVRSQRNNPVSFFVEYRDGKYMKDILHSLTDIQNANVQIIGQKFGAMLQLYTSNKTMYKEAALNLAIAYLQHFTPTDREQYWEGGFHMPGMEETDFNYMSHSSCAFHLLFINRKETALQLMDEWLQRKIFIHLRTLKLFYYHLQQQSFNCFETILQRDTAHGGVDYFRSVIGFVHTQFAATECMPLIWLLISNKSKPLRAFVAGIIAEKDSDAEAKAIALLEHKNAETRQTAALILSHISTPTSKAAIMKVLNAETNDNARDILLQTIADNLPVEASMGFIEDMVQAAKSRGKLNKPIDSALDESALPPLIYTSGKELTADESRFLLYRMSRIKEMRSDMEARYILQFIDKTKSSVVGAALIKLFIDKGAKPEHKWLMALAALLGDDAVVDKIRITINKWMEENRYKMAEHGVGALALHGSDKALRWVEWYSRKYRTKKANVGTAALQALETAAEELGISTHELGDRIVPDFGFDGLFKHFTVDGEEYRAFIDSHFKIAFFNEDNKKLKAIPAAADASLKESFKAIAKEVRDIVKSQSSRLEYYLIIQRKWTYGQWQSFFLQNPVMFIYATKLLWGVYDEKGSVQYAFTCNEDTTLLDINNDEISIDEKATVGIVHPVQLDDVLLKQWQKLFFDLAIDPVFPQLDRKLPSLKSYDLTKRIITKFNGKKTKEGAIRSTLERYGWHKGPTGDGGILESFNMLYFEKGIEAVLEVDGVGAGYGWGLEEKLGRLYIIDKVKVPQKWFTHPGSDADERLIRLSDVPEIFLSEALAAIESIKLFEAE